MTGGPPPALFNNLKPAPRLHPLNPTAPVRVGDEEGWGGRRPIHVGPRRAPRAAPERAL